MEEKELVYIRKVRTISEHYEITKLKPGELDDVMKVVKSVTTEPVTIEQSEITSPRKVTDFEYGMIKSFLRL